MCTRPLSRFAPQTNRNLRRWIMATWSAGVARIVNAHVHVEGAPPRSQFFIVANHLSYLDIVLFAQTLGCVFVAMHEMADWPIIGVASRAMDTIFINRKSWRDALRVNEEVRSALDAGHSVMVFPESTTSHGRDLLSFRAALLEAPIAAGLPVHSAAIQYHRTPQCPDPDNRVCWVDDIPFLTHGIGLLRLPRIDATIRFSPIASTAPDRKALAATLETAVRELLPPRQDTLSKVS